jgi:tetraacyldisaccharide 4'-kinase
MVSLVRFIRLLLFPFSIVYGLITYIRNVLFDLNIFNSYTIPIKSICVGNLSVGGTGKTPHVMFLINKLIGEKSVAVLSRGYGRKTKGFRYVTTSDNALNVGDEPLSYAFRFTNKIIVSVCESRVFGVKKLLNEQKLDLIILDDAFQHRRIKAGMNILLTEYASPYFGDVMLPTGNLREYKRGVNRADILIITKCPDNIDLEEKERFIQRSEFDATKVFFSIIKYGLPNSFTNVNYCENATILLVTGIANPMPLVKHVTKKNVIESLFFPDHHSFSLMDIQKIHTKFDGIPSQEKLILTTEKDYMRLKDRLGDLELEKYPWFYLPIEISIDREEEFINEIKDYVRAI